MMKRDESGVSVAAAGADLLSNDLAMPSLAALGARPVDQLAERRGRLNEQARQHKEAQEENDMRFPSIRFRAAGAGAGRGPRIAHFLGRGRKTVQRVIPLRGVP